MQPWQTRSQLILFFQVTESHSGCWMNSLKCHGPVRKFFGNFEAILALALRTRDNGFLSRRANPHPNGRDRKSRCSFIDSSERWLGFYRHFSHYENSHYKNCKIKGKLQIRCWIFITELIKTQSKQKLLTLSKTHPARQEAPTHISSTSSVGLKAWLTSGVGHVFMAMTVSGTEGWPTTQSLNSTVSVNGSRNHFNNLPYTYSITTQRKTKQNQKLVYGCWLVEGRRKLCCKNSFIWGKAHKNPNLMPQRLVCCLMYMVCLGNSEQSLL